MPRTRDVAIAVAVALGTAPVLALALWRLPLAALAGVLAGLAGVAAVCAWELRRAEGPASEPRASSWPSARRHAVGGRARRRAWRASSGAHTSWAVPSPLVARSRPTGPSARAATDLGDVLRRLEALEARQAWLDGGIAELEAYAQTGPADPPGDGGRTH